MSGGPRKGRTPKRQRQYGSKNPLPERSSKMGATCWATKSPKVSYRNRQVAEAEMRFHQKLDSSDERVPVRAYKCPSCRLWHLTATSQRQWDKSQS